MGCQPTAIASGNAERVGYRNAHGTPVLGVPETKSSIYFVIHLLNYMIGVFSDTIADIEDVRTIIIRDICKQV
ncbi:hypothetical protein BG842_01585 [Haladaptatus sp. W1]|nr:hypothetical protein BG842_01585 [Haladaptatus sp. W1]